MPFLRVWSLYEVSEATDEVCTVVLSDNLGTEVTLNLQTSDGTALSTSDYTTLQSVLTFSPSYRDSAGTFLSPTMDCTSWTRLS